MGKNKNILFYLKKHKWAVAFYVLLVVIACASSGVSTILSAQFLANITVGNFEIAIRLLIFVGVVTVVHRVSWWVIYLIYFKYTNLIWVEIAKDLTSRCFELSSSTFSNNESGMFVQRIIADPNNVLMQLSAIVEVFADIITHFVIIIYIMTLNWIIGLIYLVLLFGLFFLEIRRKKVGKKNRVVSKKINDKTYSIFTEIIKSEKDIKSLGLEEKLYDIADSNLNELKNANLKFDVVDTNFYSARNIIIEIFGIFIFFLGIYLVDLGTLALASFILIYSNQCSVYDLVWAFGNIAKNLNEVTVSSNRMFSLYNENLYKSDEFGNVELKNIKGKITFKNVTFAYSDVEEVEVKNKKKTKKELKYTKKEPIFKELSFTIKPNSTIAFVGKSGSGKSTIASLISKLNVVDSGEILIDKTNINDLTKTTIRENISMINQFPYIFDMSIKDNLLMVKKDATDEELWDVLNKSSFDEDVLNMPNGIYTKVGETGVKLSGGQRQRLAIARALLKNSKIIIFDESTSSLDNFAQSNIQKSIENLKGQHTIIIIAHRLSTIKNVDKIFFLEKGQIKAEGSFDELFNNNSDFQNMFMIENI